MVDVNIVNAEVLTVAPDEVLIVRIPQTYLGDGALDAVCQEFERLLDDRFVIFCGDVEFAKVQRDG